MIVLADLVTALDVDLRQLPPDLARPLFLQAFRNTRMLTHTLEGAWDAYREGRLLPKEAKLVAQTLEEHFAPVPEYGRLVCLGLAHDGAGPALKTMALTVQTPQEEQGALAALWQVLSQVKPHYQLVTYGGTRWGNAFLKRRTLLLGLAPSGWLPTGRVGREDHFDVDDILSNGDRTRIRPLELAALQYGIPGPWAEPDDPHGADTAGALRQAVARGDRELALTLAHARLAALWELYQRLAPTHVA